jgi:LysM repeat protein/ABC-type branched-subunit amino acid transport system substrate-binding protein
MRKIYILSLLVFFTSSLFAQEDATSSIKRSTDKVKIEGNYYYIHIVKKGETLYSISRAYNVSQVEIATENPDIYLGLQVDQAIKIPIKDQQIMPSDEDEKYIYHVVRRRETLFSLSRRYEISMEEIIKTNPEVEQGLKTNQVVLIPKRKVETLGDMSPQRSERFIYHEVKPREGFYAISKKYNVTEETIRKFNEDLVKDGIKLGTILRIPIDPNDTPSKPEISYFETLVIPRQVDTAKLTPSVVCDTFVYNKWRDVFNVALMLPFTQDPGVQVNDEVIDDATNDRRTSQPGDNRISGQSANFLDFYQGALLALDSLKQIGLSINLNVYNTARSARTASALTREKGVRDAHLIIGPVYQEDLTPVAKFAAENRILLVSPLSPNNSFLEKNPYLIQVNPSFNTQLEEFTKKIDFCTGQNIVLIYEADSSNLSMINGFKERISRKMSNCSTPGITHFKEVSYRPGSSAPEIQEHISHSLVLDRENLIIVPSNNEAFVSDLIANLHTLSTIHKYPIGVYGFPRWQRFRNIQIDYYYQLQIRLFTPFFVDYSNPMVNSFIAKYRDSFRAEPTQYAFQGFDVVYYFLSAMKQYGVDFQFCLPNHNVELLQSNYHFERLNSTSGFENQSVYIIQYTKDYDIRKEKPRVTNIQGVFPMEVINEQGNNRKEGILNY